jgi:hypothetical protein
MWHGGDAGSHTAAGGCLWLLGTFVVFRQLFGSHSDLPAVMGFGSMQLGLCTQKKKSAWR